MNDIFQPSQPTGFLRIRQVLQIIPVSKSTWWAGVRTGRFPKPVKLSPGVTAWRAQDIHDYVRKQSHVS